MFCKKTMTLIAAGLLAFAMLASGGCLGDSDSSKTNMTLVKIGVVGEKDTATLKEEGVSSTEYSGAKLAKHRDLLISGYDALGAEQLTAIQKMFAEEGAASVSLYHPTQEEMTKLKTLLGTEGTVVIDEKVLSENEDTTIRVFSIAKDANGNIHSSVQLLEGADAKYTPERNDGLRPEDTGIGEGKYVWVRYNKSNGADTPYDVIQYELEEFEDSEEKYYRIKSKTVIGQIAESAVTVDEDSSKITARLNEIDYPCMQFQKKDCSYALMRQGIELPEEEQTCIRESAIPVTDEEKKAAGMMTDAEKLETARKTSMQGFARWLTDSRYTEQKAIADMGLSKPKTALGKMLAFVKDLFGGSSIACADDTTPDLYYVSCTTVATIGKTFLNVPGLNLSSTSYIAAAHHFEGSDPNGGDDYYYIKQTNVLNCSCTQRRHWYEGSYYNNAWLPADFGEYHDYWIGGAECDEFYARRYQFKTSISPNETIDEPDIYCIKASPEAYNKQTTTMVGHDTSFGAGTKAGCSKSKEKGLAGDLGLSLTFGYSSNEKEMYTTDDIEASLDNQGKVVTWGYNVTVTPHRGKPWTKVTYPCKLATSTYQPATAYIWQIKTSARSKYDSVWTRPGIQLEGCYSKNSGSVEPRYWSTWVYASGCIALTKPPLFCLDKDTINFNETTAKTDYVKIYSQGDWDWDKATVPDWLTLHFTPSNSQLTVVAKPNDTGDLRTATIELQREDGSEAWDKRTLTVTQSPYSK